MTMPPSAEPAPVPPDAPPTAELLPLHRFGGDPDHAAEFTAFMTTHTSTLSRTAWFLCGDVHQAEELTQLALMRTYLAWGKARQRDPLAYARKILANARIDTWRRRRREVLTAPDDLPTRTTPDDTTTLADRDQLTRALATLTRRQRRIVVLRHLEDLPERDVADLLGISTGTVKSTASRALAQLRQQLEGPDTRTITPGVRSIQSEGKGER